MRIIDKNKDFYDYLQNIYRDDSVVFDRRKSFVFKKEDFLYYFTKDGPRKYRKDDDADIRYLLLQVCNTFWLIEMHCEYKEDYNMYADQCVKYTLRLIHKWDEYKVPRKLICLYEIRLYSYSANSIENIEMCIRTNDYRINRDLTHGRYWVDKKPEEGSIPILRDLGFSEVIDPQDIYLAFEEYFVFEKADIESRTESIGLTDIDKVTNHGFDKKTSFRGKQ